MSPFCSQSTIRNSKHEPELQGVNIQQGKHLISSIHLCSAGSSRGRVLSMCVPAKISCIGIVPTSTSLKIYHCATSCFKTYVFCPGLDTKALPWLAGLCGRLKLLLQANLPSAFRDELPGDGVKGTPPPPWPPVRPMRSGEVVLRFDVRRLLTGPPLAAPAAVALFAVLWVDGVLVSVPDLLLIEFLCMRESPLCCSTDFLLSWPEVPSRCEVCNSFSPRCWFVLEGTTTWMPATPELIPIGGARVTWWEGVQYPPKH